MDGEPPVHSWLCSYYLNSEKRWTSGRLTLTPSAVRFSPGGDGGALLLLPLSRVTHVSTESSCFIFSAVTLQERDAQKHWFSSLKPSAGAVFHVLQHFWRETLAMHTHAAHTPLSRGQRLISMVSDAQHTLSHTGRALSQQGEQFHHMIHQLDKMESDLGVADKLLSELESPPWWPFGKFPWNRKCQSESGNAEAKAPPPEASPRSSKEILSVPVVFYRGGDINNADVNSGALVLLASSMEVRDTNGRLVHRFHKQEVDEIRVHGVCDISVRQRHIGKPDVCFRLLSAKMAEVLCVLEVQYKKKVEFARDYSGFQATPSDDVTPASAAFWGAGAGSYSDVPVQLPAGDLTPVQLHAQESAVSQEEAQELKQMLLQLKSLALETDSELQRQDEALDVLMSSSERNTANIDTQTRRMRRLL
ncbi:synaptosomal-associated protein 47 [Clarias gariepinus]|uniref:synaptosomal-associated protein 47 n=1 Tax=Clarias gariepinus TaxID=13013 RepID=UPI00234C2F63|nr:synaptosomal-associated protein 47 [Clarias gariepinus]XP_053351522.1 synaptosomal-associated protein 47 [Clarias gariepinus]